ncbi:hypothetical protein AB0M46_47380 [Dactylosporangium sp. NPDC051485]|uniref:hypothetical protein n=1 Tax=Dactylosporangium sp. NPDC051485 TaxID=3154846 RepID=UPI0034448100
MAWILRWRWVVAGLGLVAGAGLGLAVWAAGLLPGPWLFAMVGALAGAVVAGVYLALRGTARLDGVKISVPNFTELSFTITDDRRRIAWTLFVEVATRTSTQPLADGTGSLREALTSLYGLFGCVRNTLEEAPPTRVDTAGPTVEYLAIALLNDVLRPFLSRWHPELLAWERANPAAAERDWPLNRPCRADLAAVQERVAQYAMGFAELAEFTKDYGLKLLHAGAALGPAPDPALGIPAQQGPDDLA